MNRKKLVIIEILLIIIIVLGTAFLMVNPYFILKGLFKNILYVNDNNRPVIENLLKESKYYGNENFEYLKDISEVKKIQFFLVFNDFEFTLYYKDGTTQEIVDDDLSNLEKYIKKNGYDKAEVYMILGVFVIILCIAINGVRKDISNKIKYIDKESEVIKF